MLDALTLPSPVWVMAPHPDDEALGCGALLAALSEGGAEVWALLVTDGGASHPNSRRFPRPRLAQERLSEWRAGLAELGVMPERTHALGFPDGQLGEVDPSEVRRAMEQAWSAASPRTLLLPWRRDPHPDHRACWTHARPLLASIPTVLEYAVWLPQRGAPSDWPQPEDAVEECLFAAPLGLRERKARAIAAHRTQLGLIDDDPTGFTLSADMVARATDEPETYFRHKFPAQTRLRERRSMLGS